VCAVFESSLLDSIVFFFSSAYRNCKILPSSFRFSQNYNSYCTSTYSIPDT